MFDRVREMLEAKIAAIVQRVVVNLVNDGTMMQTVQVDGLAGQTDDTVERLQGYGISFNPPEGSEGLALSPGGERKAMIVLLLEDREQRPTGANPGEGGLYYMGAWKVFLKDDGTLRIGSEAADQPVPRGNDLKSTIETMWDDIAGAVELVAATGVNHAASQAEFALKKTQLTNNLAAALSEKVFGE